MRETLPVPGKKAAAWGSGRPDLELGEGARKSQRRRRCDDRWCGKRPLRRLCTDSTPVGDGNVAKMRANRMDNSAVQVMLPSWGLLTSRRSAAEEKC